METTSKISLKILIDKRVERVLFAEASKDFVDFLFEIFLLPLGSLVNLLSDEHKLGCLGKLYGSIENLSETYMENSANKDGILNPKTRPLVSNAPLLLPGISVSRTRELYGCSGSYYSDCYTYVSDDPQRSCPQCNRKLGKKLNFVLPSPDGGGKAAADAGEGGYVKGVITYTVTDDLVVTPMSTISSITLLSKLNVKNLGDLKEKVVDFSKAEALKLLKASLQSETVLTDVFLGKEKLNIERS